LTPRRSTDPVPDKQSVPAGKARRNLRPLSRLSIQSKIMVLLLASSLASLGVICVVEYVSGRRALLPAAAERMIGLRESQKRAVEMLFGDLTNSLIVYSNGSTVVEAVQAFTAGFDELGNATIDPAQQQSLVNFYNDKLIKPIQRETGEKLSLPAVLPPCRRTALRPRPTTLVTAAHGRPRMLVSTTTFARSRPASNTGTPCCSTLGETWSTA
jgi:hypothetical protein